jgi:hypothetical protein
MFSKLACHPPQFGMADDEVATVSGFLDRYARGSTAQISRILAPYLGSSAVNDVATFR